MSLWGSMTHNVAIIRVVVLLGLVRRATTAMSIICILIQVIGLVGVIALVIVRGGVLLLVPLKLTLLGG
jgi:hypothetical protein